MEIQRLVELLKTVILNDCATSTVSSYAGAANRWIDWCKSYSFRPLQCNPTAVTLYLTSLSDRGLSRSSILGAAYGIAWPGLEKYLNSTLPVGQVTPKFCLPGALPRLPKFSNSLIIHEPKN